MPRDVSQIVMDVQTDGISRTIGEFHKVKDALEEVQKKAEDLAGTLSDSAPADSIKDLTDKSTELVGKLSEADKQFESLAKGNLSDLSDEMWETYNAAHEAAEKWQDAVAAYQEGKLGEDELEHVEEVFESRMDGMDDLNDEMEDMYENEQDLAEDVAEAREKAMGDYFDEYKQHLKGIKSSIESGELEGMIQSAAELMKAADSGDAGGGGQGGVAQSVSGGATSALAEGGVRAAANSGMGGALAKTGGVLAGVGLLVGFLMDLSNAQYEWNAQLLETVSILDVVDTQFGQFDENLRSLHASIGEEQEQLGLTEKDIAKVANSLAETNVLMDDLEAKMGDMATKAFRGNFRSLMTDLRTPAAVFGQEVGQIASLVGEISEKTGEQLDVVSEKMYNVADSARASELNMENFYGTIQKLVTSMAMYNLKLEDSAGLLSNVSEYLNAEDSQEFVQHMSNLGDMSIQDSASRKVRAGEKFTDRVMREELLSMLQGHTGTLKAAGLKGSASQMFKRAGSMSESQYRKLLADVKAETGQDTKAFRRIQNALMGIRSYTSDEVSKLDAFKYIGTGGNMRITMREIQNILDATDQTLSKASSELLGKMTGQSEETIEQIKRFAPAAQGVWEKIEQAGTAQQKAAIAAEHGFDNVTTKQGKLVDERGRAVKGWIDLMLSSGAMDEGDREKMRDLVKEMHDGTTTWQDWLKRQWQELMQHIREIKDGVLNFSLFGSGPKRDVETEGRAEAYRTSKKALDRYRKNPTTKNWLKLRREASQKQLAATSQDSQRIQKKLEDGGFSRMKVSAKLPKNNADVVFDLDAKTAAKMAADAGIPSGLSGDQIYRKLKQLDWSKRLDPISKHLKKSTAGRYKSGGKFNLSPLMKAYPNVLRMVREAYTSEGTISGKERESIHRDTPSHSRSVVEQLIKAASEDVKRDITREMWGPKKSKKGAKTSLLGGSGGYGGSKNSKTVNHIKFEVYETKDSKDTARQVRKELERYERAKVGLG